jgi:phospholipid transport system substrate-binding protein
MMKRRIALGVATTALVATAPGLFRHAIAELDGDRAVAFVKNTGDQLLAVINDSGGERDKRAALARIIDASVDVEGVARFCLGRFWRTASPDEQREFIEAFHAMLVNNIAGRLGDYQGVRFTVGRVQHRDDAEVVATTLERPNSPPWSVVWLIADVAGAPKIEDMIAEGVSLRVTERSDYTAFLARNGNNVRSLIEGLRQKLAMRD